VPFTGVVFPVEVPRVTMPFRATETKWYSDERPHRGLDVAPFPGSEGRPVFAPLGAMVLLVDDHEFAGKEVVLECSVPYAFGATALDGVSVRQVGRDQVFWLRLAHHSQVNVRVGNRVRAGDVVALVGSTGRFTTGPHVHVELRVGDSYAGGEVLNPLDFLVAAIPGLRNVVQMPWPARV
jgi:murein DD-endopeptidase MepM/ murein hydrolase activator NlpD